MDSNHRTRKRADLQSAAVGHLATCPFLIQIYDVDFGFDSIENPQVSKNQSEPLVGIEPTTYWLQISCSTSWAKVAFIIQMSAHLSYSGWDNKELPQNFGKAKVKEFANWKIFWRIFYADNQKKKTSEEVLKKVE